MRRFRHLGEEWEVESTGMGWGTGPAPAVSTWGVIFRSISNPARGIVHGQLGKPDVNQVSEEDLRKSLEVAFEKSKES